MNVQLPKIKPYRADLITNFYGSNYLISKYIGLQIKYKIIHRYWQHGWISSSRQYHSDVVASEPILNKKALILVARKDEEYFLHKKGFRSKAIGLPYCYVPERKFLRKNSLLIMPAHGTRDILIETTTEYNKFIKYASSQRQYFEDVVVCMHKEDINNGYNEKWIVNGFKVVQGASIDDANALIRMHSLFSQFETVLSDSIGSHIVYAAASGVKISMIKPIGWKFNIKGNQFFNEDEGRLGPEKDTLLGTDTWYIDYNFLFCDPVDAKTHIEWGKKQIGLENKLSPKELKKVLGWTHPRREFELLVYNGKRVVNKVRRVASSFLMGDG